MEAFDQLKLRLPQPPDYAWDWKGLWSSPLAPRLRAMEATPQDPDWHGEGDVWTHTRMVCEWLAASPEFRKLPERARTALSLAALLHDVAKPERTRFEDGRLRAHGHAATGAQIARRILWQDFGLCGSPENVELREAVCLLVRYHGAPPHLLEREDGERRLRWMAADGALTPLFTLRLLFLLAEADARGKIAPDVEEISERVRLAEMMAQDCGCLDGPFEFPSAHTLRAYLGGREVWPELKLYDDSWGEVLLMCGLPGVGKDTWLRKHRPELPVVSLDAIRAELGARRPEDRGRVIQLAHERAREYLRRHQPFAWNATSLTPDLRGGNVGLFENYGAAVRIVYLETPWPENLRRNANRAAVVPEGVLDAMLGKLVPPERGEARYVEWRCV